MTEKEIEKIRAEEAQKYSLEGEAFGVETARDFLDGFDACLEKIARPALAEWKANYQREFSMWCEINEGLKKRIAELTAEVERLKNGQRN